MRALIISAAVALTAVLAPGAAHAAPPSNDDFTGATEMGSLPFTSTVDTSEGTAADDDPFACWWSTSSVWYRYTAPADGFVRMTTDRPDDEKPAISAYTGERGALTWTPGACQYPHGGGSNTFAVTAGTTYHFLLQDTRFAGPVTFGVELVPRAVNDDFAAAVDVPLNTDVAGDTGPATLEAGEPVAGCDRLTTRSLWYRYTADRAGFVSAQVTQKTNGPGVTVFRGTALNALTEVDCQQSASSPAIFAAAPGETYYLRVADGIYGASPLTLRLTDAPQIKPTATLLDAGHASVFDEIRFSIDPGDPAGRWLAGGEVRFGDGATAAIPAVPGPAIVSHKYATDGEYELTITGHTADGRSGTSTQPLKVETHDVTVSNVVAPATATVGDTGHVEVSVTNTRYDEKIGVELLRRRSDGYYTVVGTVRQQVAKDGTVTVPFSYVYSADDAAIGKATLKAQVRIEGQGRFDNNEVDNERVVETIVVAAR